MWGERKVMREHCVAVLFCWRHPSVSSSNCLLYSTFPSGERAKTSGWRSWWVRTPLQPEIWSLSCWHLRGYLLVPSCGPCSRFALAFFQLWEVKCKQFTDLLWLGRAQSLAARNVTWTPLKREAELSEGALVYILSESIRKRTQQFKGDVCWRQRLCCPISY